jgi:hypothetical protein
LQLQIRYRRIPKTITLCRELESMERRKVTCDINSEAFRGVGSDFTFSHHLPFISTRGFESQVPSSNVYWTFHLVFLQRRVLPRRVKCLLSFMHTFKIQPNFDTQYPGDESFVIIFHFLVIFPECLISFLIRNRSSPLLKSSLLEAR